MYFPQQLNIDSIHVLLAGHEIDEMENVKETELELLGVVGMVKHPKFEAKTFTNDIAVLKFNDPILSLHRTGLSLSIRLH